MVSVLLIAEDSKLPNLAMMKISAYHKNIGDDVGFFINDPDIVYVSQIFKSDEYNNYKLKYPNAYIIQGGPGYDETVRLPPEIEQTPPDQDLYDSEYSIARVTSGCIRKCHFCMVHLLEPDGIRYIMHPSLQWKPGTILRLLDDNILAMPKAFWEVHELSTKNNVKIHFEYLDIRLVTPEIARGLFEFQSKEHIYFAFDFINVENDLRTGVKNMIDAGFKPQKLNFYVYCHDEKSIPDARRRIEILSDLKCKYFLMVNKDNATQGLIRIRRKANNRKTQSLFTLDDIFDENLTIEQIVKRYKDNAKQKSFDDNEDLIW